ncbi:glycosyltransferase involved in cell wall biosynthesis [Planomicrobium koreense]|uniref:Glycosyltransferase involved in cell wall biosynthesis n=2 Tax=Planococcus koreensis TaxID=112331 RepID=A0A7W8CPW8_9BACL|nr:glycosyltransferase involved in cell wall biosynthesis [Planococcus koreensis]
MLTKLVKNNLSRDVEMIIITFLYSTYFNKEIEDAGIKIHTLNINKGMLGPLKLFKIFRIIIDEKPVIIQTWMYHADFLGVILKLLFPSIKVIWNIRHSNLVKGIDKKTTIILANILGKLSFIPDKIICGSNAAYSSHREIGYRRNKLIVIPNGFDTNLFAPSKKVKKSVVNELSIPEGNLIIGHIGRENKIKNQDSIIDAFSKISEQNKNLNLILIGKGLKNKYKNHPLITENIIILDEVNGVERYLKSFDLFILSSFSEGFPNVLGEAMASEVPCISTNVGDSSIIIGKKELLIRDFSAYAIYEKIDYWLSLNEIQKEKLKKYSRTRILDFFSIEKIVMSYLEVYKSFEINK